MNMDFLKNLVLILVNLSQYCSKIDTNFVIDGIESAYYINDRLKLIEKDF